MDSEYLSVSWLANTTVFKEKVIKISKVIQTPKPSEMSTTKL